VKTWSLSETIVVGIPWKMVYLLHERGHHHSHYEWVIQTQEMSILGEGISHHRNAVEMP
jgi:hypothetical protein